jgi:uncharacterized membrane protein YfcA
MMDDTIGHAMLTFVAGVATGVLSAAFGVGGAVLSTPAIRLLGVSAAMAVGTTLPSILPSAATGTWRYSRERLVRWPVVAWTAPAGMAASVAGAFLSKEVPGDGHWLMILTAVLLGVTAWRMVHERPVPPPGHRPRPALLVAIGTAAGLLSGLLGVGGGTVMVPGFTELARIPLKAAIATSLVCVGVFAVPGTLAHWSVGDIDWRTAILLSVGVVPGARLGSHLSVRAAEARLRTTVAAFLGVIAVAYAVSEATALARG